MYFVVTSRQGPSWDPSKPMRGQQLWSEHATFINSLMDEGFLLLGGPVTDGSNVDDDFASVPVGDEGLYRAMVVVQAADGDEVARRVEQDPWVRSGLLERTSLERWDVLAGDLPPAMG